MSEFAKQGKLVILSAPSGAGKTTIMRELLVRFPELEFSVSATSRAPRGEERHGKDYWFFTPAEFQSRVEADQFVEWEEVYAGTRYGTLKSEMERIWNNGNVIIFDVDVVGGVNLKKKFTERALSVFIMPPSVEELEKRLRGRGTDSEEMIARRVAKAVSELEYARYFDRVVINDDLHSAVEHVVRLVSDFIRQK